MLFSTPVMAVEPITGAFGFKLGDVWDGEAVQTFEEYRYYFIPDLPHDLFDLYAVEVTPVKKLIYMIAGAGHKKGDCEQYQNLKK